MNTVTTPSGTTEAGTSAWRRWSRLAARFASLFGQPAQINHLAVDGLPAPWTALAQGKLYAIYAAARTPGSDALIWASGKSSSARDVTLVLARERHAVTARLQELGFSAERPARGWPRGLSVLAMPPEPPSVDPAARPVTFARLVGGLRALRQFSVRPGALYIVEGAERWFSWSDPVALAREGRALADWCARRRIALVLLLGAETPAAVADDEGDAAAFEATSDDPFDHLANQPGRREFHAVCEGVARLQRTHGELVWNVDFWRAGDTLVTGEALALRFTDAGRLQVAPADDDASHGTESLLARDEQRVIATHAVVRGHENWLPSNWEIVADQDAVLKACLHAQAATVLLDYRGGAALEALCAAIHMLRRQCGRALKIAIVERGEVLRHQYEMLVLSLGANLVLGRDLPFSRIQSVLQSLQGQLHTRPVAADYRTALAAALSDSALGYLPVGAFCERVQAALARSAPLQLPHVLVKLTLAAGTAHAEALRHFAPRRAGDVLTADAAHLYVFLFACRPADVDMALVRITDVAVDVIADRVACFPEQAIESELKALDAANRRTPFADYSDLWPKTAPAEGPAPEPVFIGANANAARPLAEELAAAPAAAAMPAASDGAAVTPTVPVPPRARRAARASMPVRVLEVSS